ncbi:hypothetical protein, partial [Lysinibacillus xylanilyticus]|uniref:hypothetical protein n=1 Tax=Lysinibacillus xylanilyticus TaxID=582475 RepID=UPI0036DB9A70
DADAFHYLERDNRGLEERVRYLAIKEFRTDLIKAVENMENKVNTLDTRKEDLIRAESGEIVSELKKEFLENTDCDTEEERSYEKENTKP